MAFINTISPQNAEGEVRAMYARQQEKYGHVPNYAKVFCHRPEIMGLWAQLLAGIRRHIQPHEFELATVAAAHGLKNSACSLAHGKALTAFHSPREVIDIVENLETSTLTEPQRALVRFARKVAVDAASITSGDVDNLRQQGFSDGEIFDIAAAASARSFFAKLLDALGVQADSPALAMDEELRACLAVGRPVSGEAVERLP